MSDKGEAVLQARIAELEGDVVRLSAQVAALDEAWGNECAAHEATRAALVSAQNAKQEADEYITRQARITDHDFDECDLERRNALREIAALNKDFDQELAAHAATKAQLEEKIALICELGKLDKEIYNLQERRIANALHFEETAKAALARVSADCSEKTARLRKAESACEQQALVLLAIEEVMTPWSFDGDTALDGVRWLSARLNRIQNDGFRILSEMGVPECGDLVATLAWLREHLWQGKAVSA